MPAERETVPLCVLVVDTNVHLDRFWRNLFFHLVSKGTVLVRLSKQIYGEMFDVYYVRGRDSRGKERKKKFNLTKEQIDANLSLTMKIHSHGQALWDIPKDADVDESIKNAISDKDDYHVIELARKGGASYIITHDQAFPKEYEVVKTGRTIKSLTPLAWMEEMLDSYKGDDEKLDKLLDGMAFACALTKKFGLDDALKGVGIDVEASEIWAPLMPRLRVLYKRFRAKLG